MGNVDATKANADSKVDASSQESSQEAKPSSQAVEFTKEQEAVIQQRVDKKVNDILAQKGDKAKTLEDRVLALESENSTLKEKELASTASKYGLTTDQVKEIGVSDPAMLAKIASLFGKSTAQADDTKTLKVDSGKTLGGMDDATFLTEFNKGVLSTKEDIARAKKIIFGT